jgi:general secretion pathway protein E/type IV pilus assembly protein PilB
MTEPRAASPVDTQPLLGDQLIRRGLLTADQLAVALHEQQRTGRKLAGVLLDLGFVDRQALTDILADQDDDPAISSAVAWDAALIQRVPTDIALQHQILPLALQGDVLSVATLDACNLPGFDAIRPFFPPGVSIRPVRLVESELRAALERFYRRDISLDEALAEFAAASDRNSPPRSADDDDSPVVRFVSALLAKAVLLGASDIHIEPEQAYVRVRCRIDGILHPLVVFHRDFWTPVCIRIKIVSGMNIAQSQRSQDGRLSLRVGGRDVDMRVATHPTIFGENIVVRILDKDKSVVALETLGLSAHNLAVLQQLLRKPEGLFVVTGPTGSGKTTTLYAILGAISTPGRNVMTLEEPVEYRMPLVRQTEIREGATFSFADGVRSILRQDPDVILVGEIRDEATAQMALRAAMTGHQVFATLHTNDAISAIARLMDLGLSPHMLSGNLTGILAQRLVRRLCGTCRRETAPAAEACAQLGIARDAPVVLYAPSGCPRCHQTGYKGRTAIAEVLPITETLDDLIATRGTRLECKRVALQEGFRTLADDARRKVLDGSTALEEVADRL